MSLFIRRHRHIGPATHVTFDRSRGGDPTLGGGGSSPGAAAPAVRLRDNDRMNTDVVPRLAGWQQTWRLVAAAALGILFWLSTGAALPRGCANDTCSWFVTGDPLLV